MCKQNYYYYYYQGYLYSARSLNAASALQSQLHVKQNVFSLRLNVSSPTSDVRSSAGRLFHERGPWTAKLRSP